MSWSLSILTPVQRVHVGPAESVTLPTAAGELTLLPGHVPLMGLVVAGLLELRGGPAGAPSARFVIGSGGLEVTETGVVVMVESATAAAGAA